MSVQYAPVLRTGVQWLLRHSVVYLPCLLKGDEGREERREGEGGEEGRVERSEEGKRGEG